MRYRLKTSKNFIVEYFYVMPKREAIASNNRRIILLSKKTKEQVSTYLI